MSLFGVNAMELTSTEILDLLRGVPEVKSVYDKLQQILQLADFVKFAKIHPLPNENDLSLVNAYLFVNATKPVEVVPEDAETADEENTNDAKNLYLTYALLNSIGEREIDEMGKTLVADAAKVNPLVKKLKELQGQLGRKTKTTSYSKTA